MKMNGLEVSKALLESAGRSIGSAYGDETWVKVIQSSSGFTVVIEDRGQVVSSKAVSTAKDMVAALNAAFSTGWVRSFIKKSKFQWWDTGDSGISLAKAKKAIARAN